MSFEIFYFVNFPKIRDLTNLGLALFDLNIFSKTFYPILLSDSNKF